MPPKRECADDSASASAKRRKNQSPVYESLRDFIRTGGLDGGRVRTAADMASSMRKLDAQRSRKKSSYGTVIRLCKNLARLQSSHDAHDLPRMREVSVAAAPGLHEACSFALEDQWSEEQEGLFRLNYRFSSAFCVVEEWVRSGALHGAIMRIKPAADAAYAWALQHLQAAGSDALPAQPKYNDAYNVLCFCAGQEMAGGRGGTGAAGAAAVAAMAKDPLVREVEAPGGWGHTGTTFGYTAVDTPTHLDEKWKVETAAPCTRWQCLNWVLRGMEGSRIMRVDEVPELVAACTAHSLAEVGSELELPQPSLNDAYNGVEACLAVSVPPAGSPPAARLVVARGNRGINAFFKGYVLWGADVTEDDISRWRLEQQASAQPHPVREYVATLQPGVFVSEKQAAAAAQQLTAQRLAAAGSAVVPVRVDAYTAGRVLNEAAGAADEDGEEGPAPLAGLSPAMAAAVADLPPEPVVRLRRLGLEGSSRVYTHADTTGEQIAAFIDERGQEAAARRERIMPTLEQVLARHVFGSGEETVAVDRHHDEAIVAITTHEHSDHTYWFRLVKALRRVGLDSAIHDCELVVSSHLESLIQVITSIDTPVTQHSPVAGAGVGPARISGLRSLPLLQLTGIGHGRHIVLFNTRHSLASSGAVISFADGGVCMSTGDGCFDAPGAVDDAVAAVQLVADDLAARGLAMRFDRLVVDDTRASRSVARSGAAQPTRQESLQMLLPNLRRMLRQASGEGAADLVVMLGHRASGRSAAAEVLSRSLNLGPVYLSDRIFMFELASRGPQGMAPFTDDPTRATLHLLTMGGTGVPLKYADRAKFLRDYAARVQPGRANHSIVLVDSAGWCRPGDGVRFSLGGVRVLGASLSDHSTLAGVRSLVSALSTRFGLQQAAVLQLTSPSDDVSHLMEGWAAAGEEDDSDWEEEADVDGMAAAAAGEWESSDWEEEAGDSQAAALAAGEWAGGNWEEISTAAAWRLHGGSP